MAQSPPNDPTRQILLARLADMEEKHREHWLGVLRETDQIHAAISQVPVPDNLADRLLIIPDKATARPRFLRPAFIGTLAAACLLAVIGSYFLSIVTAPKPPRPLPPMQEAMAMRIATTAVAQYSSEAEVQVSSTDTGKLQSELAAHSMPFPVLVLHPRMAMDLAGGGVCDFQGSAAVYTRWKADGLTYTVYEIDQKSLGTPARFKTTTETSPLLWRGDHHYRVVIWPGSANCTWAMVMDGEKASDAFSSMPY